MDMLPQLEFKDLRLLRGVRMFATGIHLELG